MIAPCLIHSTWNCSTWSKTVELLTAARTSLPIAFSHRGWELSSRTLGISLPTAGLGQSPRFSFSFLPFLSGSVSVNKTSVRLCLNNNKKSGKKQGFRKSTVLVRSHATECNDQEINASSITVFLIFEFIGFVKCIRKQVKVFVISLFVP